jgi:carbonic anhydrase
VVNVMAAVSVNFKFRNLPKQSSRVICSVKKKVSGTTLSSSSRIQYSYTTSTSPVIYEGVTKTFRTCRLEREQQMVQLSATKCSCIGIP